MAIKKRDFQKLVNTIKEFQAKLPCDESCAELRDSLNLSLLHLHKYYKRFRVRCHNGGNILDKSISLSSSLTGAASPVSPYIAPVDRFDWKWLNLDVKKLSASFGHGDKSNYVPQIFYVIRDSDMKKLRAMIEENQDQVHELDAIGRTTAMYAIQGGTEEYVECLNLLVENGVDLEHHSNDGFSCLHMACYYGYQEIIEILLEQKVSANAKDAEDRTPLHFAAAYCSSNIVEALLVNGADVMIQDREGLTAAMWACHFDQLENLQLLLDYEKKINPSPEAVFQTVDASGAGIVHWAVTRSSNIECFRYLINAETVHLCDDNGKSIFLWAAEHGCLLACEEIFNVCSDDIIDDVDNLGRSALHLATLGGHGEVVDLLLNRGASFDHCDSQGATALDYAINRKLNYCIMVFVSYQKYRERIQSLNNKLATSISNQQAGSSEGQMLMDEKDVGEQDDEDHQIVDEEIDDNLKESLEDLNKEEQNSTRNGGQQKTEIGGNLHDQVENATDEITPNKNKKESTPIKDDYLQQQKTSDFDASEKLDVQDAVGFEVEGDIEEDFHENIEEDLEFEYGEDEEVEEVEEKNKINHQKKEIDSGKMILESKRKNLNESVENESQKNREEDKTNVKGDKKKDNEDKKNREHDTDDDNGDKEDDDDDNKDYGDDHKDGIGDDKDMMVGNKEEEKANNANISIDESSIDLEDEMIVLVAHHGSDDDMVIEYGNDNNEPNDSEKSQRSNQSDLVDTNEAVKLDPTVDRDLFETSRLSPRIESVTGLMETNTMPANQSASVNISVSSLCSDSEEEIVAGQGEMKIETKAPSELFDDHNQLEYRNPFPKQRLQRQSNTRMPSSQQTEDDRPSTSHGKRKEKKSKKDKKSSPRNQSEQTMLHRIPIGPLEPMKPLQPLIAPQGFPSQGFPAQRNTFGNSTHLGNISPKSQDFMLPPSSPRGTSGFSSPSECPRTPKGSQLPSPRYGFESRDHSISHIPRPNSPRSRDDHHAMGNHGLFPRPPIGR